MYDSCITLDRHDGKSWCSINTNSNWDHIDGDENVGVCEDTCNVNHCPVGYRRSYPDQSCSKVLLY